MSYKDMARRLAILESPHFTGDVLGSGLAPKAWSHLAAWALLLHDAGGWDAEDTLPDEPSPYTRVGSLWMITHFWQRGTDRFLNARNKEIALWLIVAYVEHLLSEGMSRAEIKSWQIGRLVWDQVWEACQEYEEQSNEVSRDGAAPGRVLTRPGARERRVYRVHW